MRTMAHPNLRLMRLLDQAGLRLTATAARPPARRLQCWKLRRVPGGAPDDWIPVFKTEVRVAASVLSNHSQSHDRSTRGLGPERGPGCIASTLPLALALPATPCVL